MRVDVEEIFGMQARRRQINTILLRDIEFYQDGVKLVFDPEAIKEFKFTGLNNLDFILTDFQNSKLVNETTKETICEFPDSPLRQ